MQGRGCRASEDHDDLWLEQHDDGPGGRVRTRRGGDLASAVGKDSEPDADDGGGSLLAMAAMGLSGAIIGFIFAGHFDIASAAFAALAVGGVLGWKAGRLSA